MQYIANLQFHIGYISRWCRKTYTLSWVTPPVYSFSLTSSIELTCVRMLARCGVKSNAL